MAEFKKEIERLTERIAAERQRIRSQTQRPAPNLQRGETGSALSIMAANILAAPVSQYAPQGRGSARGLRIR